MHNGNLASIHSPLQQAFLTAEAARFAEEGSIFSFPTSLFIFPGWVFWIGLNADLSLDGSFRWSDETDITFTNWNSDEPNGVWTDEHCVEMYSERERAGKWNDKACSDLKSYICEINADPSYDSHSQDWPPCNDPQLAGQGFSQFRENCYKVATEAKTFQQAEDSCKAEGDKVHLASIGDIAEESLAIVLGQQDSSKPSDPTNLWLGLTKADDVWTWTDGWPVTYTNWFNTSLNSETCSTLHDQEMKWFQTSCEETNSYICKWTNATKPPPPPPSRCPEVGQTIFTCSFIFLLHPVHISLVNHHRQGWEDLGGDYCYKLMLDQWVSWGEAHTNCWMEVTTTSLLPLNEN